MAARAVDLSEVVKSKAGWSTVKQLVELPSGLRSAEAVLLGRRLGSGVVN